MLANIVVSPVSSVRPFTPGVISLTVKTGKGRQLLQYLVLHKDHLQVLLVIENTDGYLIRVSPDQENHWIALLKKQNFTKTASRISLPLR